MNEIQLQRCIDGELNDADRTEFLKKLEQENDTVAWRTLALGYVENQIFRGALLDDLPAVNLSAVKPPLPHHHPNSRKKTFPAWSVLTLCVGMIAGVLLTQSLSQQGTREIAQSSGQTQEPALQNAGTEIIAPNTPQVAAMDAQKQQAPDTQFPQPAMHLTWQTNENQPVSLPVYFPEQYAEASRLQQLRPFPKQWQKELESRGYKVDRQSRIYRFPLDDGRQILVPTESVQVRYAVY